MPDNYSIRADYNHRNFIRYFDDTPFTDQHQDDIYRKAVQVFETLREEAEPAVLDVGCGSAFKLLKYFGGARTLGLDVEQTVNWLRGKYPDREWQVGDWSKPPTGRFGLAICSDVIEHVEDPDALMKFLTAVNFTRLVISTPDREAVVAQLKSPENGPPWNIHHVREWSKSEFAAYVAQYLEILEHNSAAHMGQVIVAQKRMV